MARKRYVSDTRETEKIWIENIEIGTRHRKPSQDAVERLAASIRDIGLQTPITVRYFPDRQGPKGTVDCHVLVTGAHRVAAARLLGWEEIEAFVIGGEQESGNPWSDLEAEIWEIDENLMRAELTESERSRCMTRRKAIYLKKHPETDSINKRGGPGRGKKNHRQIGDGFPVDRFTKDTAEKTGISERAIQRAVTRGEKIGDENLQKIVGTSLDKGVELDALAAMQPEQQAPLIERAAAGEDVSARAEIQKADPPKPELSPAEKNMRINNAIAIIRMKMREIISLTGSQTLAMKMIEEAMRSECAATSSDTTQEGR